MNNKNLFTYFRMPKHLFVKCCEKLQTVDLRVSFFLNFFWYDFQHFVIIDTLSLWLEIFCWFGNPRTKVARGDGYNPQVPPSQLS